MNILYKNFFLIINLIVGFTSQNLAANPKKFKQEDDILLVIVYNSPFYESINFLKEIYSNKFPNIVFYGPEAYPGVEICDHNNGLINYKALGQAMEKYPNYKGYLYTNDDCFINFWNIERFDKSKIWFTGRPSGTSTSKLVGWCWDNYCNAGPSIKEVYKILPEKYKKTLEKNYGKNIAVGGFGDIVYIPASMREDAIELCYLFAKCNLYLEVAVPTLCCCLDLRKNWESFHSLVIFYNWQNTDRMEREYSKEYDVAHPIKFSKPSLKEFIKKQVEEVKASLN